MAAEKRSYSTEVTKTAFVTDDMSLSRASLLNHVATKLTIAKLGYYQVRSEPLETDRTILRTAIVGPDINLLFSTTDTAIAWMQHFHPNAHPDLDESLTEKAKGAFNAKVVIEIKKLVDRKRRQEQKTKKNK